MGKLYHEIIRHQAAPSRSWKAPVSRGELSTMHAAGEYTGLVPDMQHLGQGMPCWMFEDL